MKVVLEIELEFPIKYETVSIGSYEISDKRGKYLASTSDEAAAKLLVAFVNKFANLLGIDKGGN